MQTLIIILIVIILLILFTSIYAYNISTFTQESLFDTIPGFVYINLENREDRKKLILEEFIKLNIPQEKIYRLAGIPIPKNGHKGCVQSHILALEIAKLNQWQYVAIFEDDAELTVSPSEFKEKVSNAMKEDWDVILLHGANQSIKTKINDMMYYAKHSSQSTGYVIKESYYDTLLELFKDCNMKMNRNHWEKAGWESNALDQRWNDLMKKDKWIVFTNNLMKQRAISSSINTFNNTNIELAPSLSTDDIKQLKIAQDKILTMTKEFHNICVNNNIKYMLSYGNLLGAILYNGWIPWDGDMDIMVAEEDYNKLNNILKKDLPSFMWYQTTETDVNYTVNSIHKIRDLNSCYIEYTNNGGTYWHNGLQIDLTKYKFINNKLITYDMNNLKNINYDDIYPLKLHKYEDTNLFIPNNYEKILDQQYGPNWREILPIEQRYPHEGKVTALITCPFHYEKYTNLYSKL